MFNHYILLTQQNVCQKSLDREDDWMNSESWFSKLKKRREVKKTEKLKRDFSFMMDMIDSNYVQLIEELKRHESETGNSIFELGKKIDAISVSEQQYRENQEQCLNKIMDATCNLTRDLAKVTSIIDEKILTVQSSISETQDKVEDGNDDIKKLLQSIMSQVDSLRKDTQNSIDSGKAVLEDKTVGLLMSIEEIKTLMKIVAVNNLVDEI